MDDLFFFSLCLSLLFFLLLPFSCFIRISYFVGYPTHRHETGARTSTQSLSFNTIDCILQILTAPRSFFFLCLIVCFLVCLFFVLFFCWNAVWLSVFFLFLFLSLFLFLYTSNTHTRTHTHTHRRYGIADG